MRRAFAPVSNWLRSRWWLRKAVASILGTRVVSRPCVAGGRLWFPAAKYFNLFFSRVMNIEPEITRAMMRLLRPGDVVFDIGANIGYYTLLAGRLAGPSGRIVAVEPDPENLETLRLNLVRNGLADVVVEHRALSAASGVAALFQDRTTGRTSSLEQSAWHPDGSSSVQQIEVELTTLDRLATLYGPPSLIKCDVEGHEEQVLAGAAQTLLAHPLIFIETISRTRAAVSQLLVAHNYRFLNTEAPLVGQAPSFTIEWPNCLAFPPERAREVEGLCRVQSANAP